MTRMCHAFPVKDFGIPKWGWRVISVPVIALVVFLGFSDGFDSAEDLGEDLVGWILPFLGWILGWILVAAIWGGLLWAVIIRRWYYRRGGPAEIRAEMRAEERAAELARGATPTPREIELAKAHANTERLQDKMADKPLWFSYALLIGMALAALMLVVLLVSVGGPPG
jgi:hypothetical protein